MHEFREIMNLLEELELDEDFSAIGSRLEKVKTTIAMLDMQLEKLIQILSSDPSKKLIAQKLQSLSDAISEVEKVTSI